MERRTIIRLLLIFGIGIPILVEAATFAGLLGAHFGDGGAETTTTTAETTRVDAVGLGDELLPETNQSERLTTLSLSDSGQYWILTMTVSVNNTGDHPYEVTLGAVVTNDDTPVDGSVSTGPIPAGESRTATGQWKLPAGETPRRLQVEALVHADGEGTPKTISRTVTLQKVPVEG
ncbi:hypothetical protein VB773_14035 [Haloarculaceae archaeon H-GB2-1]|nr:hypothetical protein [Haloarculaceae archaeon H-GB1-1]MEA5387071.1 hypothetical protein [Haloarculaceae archaeon H-GB11]MEA5408576.1 hypothetical protein [Haloarculaceae archaeon H-GB2-1]